MVSDMTRQAGRGLEPLAVQPKVFVLESILHGLGRNEAFDIFVDDPEVLTQGQADPVVVRKVVQPAFRLFVDFPPSVRVQFNFLLFKPGIELGSFPVRVVAGAALEEDTAVYGVRGQERSYPRPDN